MYKVLKYLQQPFSNWYRWLVLSSVALLLLVTLPYIGAFANECGGFLSEYLLGRSGVGDSTLTLERDGVSTSTLDIGIGAIVTTQAATNITINSGRLNGNLTDLNDFPEADVYFEWGYTVAYGNVTVTQSLNAPGTFNANIGGLSSDTTVHFRTVSKLDGTYYGADQTFDTLAAGAVPSDGILGWSTEGSFIQNFIPVAIAIIILIGVLRRAKNPIQVLIGVTIGLVTFFVVRVLVGIVW